MNKVIGEFLSNQQPYPQFMATVVYKVSSMTGALFVNLNNSLLYTRIVRWGKSSPSCWLLVTPIVKETRTPKRVSVVVGGKPTQARLSGIGGQV